MAINKNFVVKNGFEVATDLILANATTKRVGIGSTVPLYTLDVRGAIGATNTYTSGVSTVITELRVGTSGTIFSVVAGVGQSVGVGVGTASPEFLLDVRSPVSTGQTALYVKGDVRGTGNINLDGDINTDEITTRNLNITGLSTFVGFATFNDYIFVQDGLNVAGAGATLNTLNVTGVSTFAGITTVTGETLFSKQLNVSGVTTLGVTTATNLTLQQLNVSGVSTFNSTLFGNQASFTGVATASSFVGSGASLTGNARNFTATIGLGTTGGVVGYGVSFIEFAGPGVSNISYNSTTGIATVNITGGGSGSASIGIGSTPGDAFVGIVSAGNLWYNTNLGRLFIYYQDTDSSQWVDAAPFNVGIITSLTNVSLTAGSATSPSMYFVGDSQTGFFSPGTGQFTLVSAGSSVLNINASGISVTGIATASGFVGNLTGTASTATAASTAYGLTGSPNITVTNVNVTGVSTFAGIATHTSSLFGTSASFTGVATASGFVGNLTGNATGLSGAPNITVGTIGATSLNATGVVTASSFVGNLTGNATGLSGSPSITVTNATVNGVLSVGGTTVILNAATLQIQDKDIVVGYTTDASNVDVSSDTTATHGGIAVASTTGSPLFNMPIVAGVNSNPVTYKQFMWIAQGTSGYSGMGTDAWVSNYPIAIGTVTTQNLSRLTVGAGFTVFDTYLDATDIRARNLNVSGISTVTDTRIKSIGEKTTIISGNTASLVYNTGGGNIAICTSPTGDITLEVTGVPTDTSFDNTAITFAAITNSTGTARSCTAVTLNGVSKSIKWIGGSLSSALTGVTTTNGQTIFTFTGINTVGSASTTDNYLVLGSVSGGFW